MLCIRFALILGLLVAIVPAQVAYVVEEGSGHAAAKYLASAGYPTTADSARGALQLPEFGNLPAAGITNNGATAGGCHPEGQKSGRTFINGREQLQLRLGRQQTRS